MKIGFLKDLLRLIGGSYLALTLVSCAAPAPEREPQTFVSDRELTAVSLVREGLDFYRRSRFVDAELKLRQAHYLFPEADNIKLNLAIVLTEQSQFDESKQIFAELLVKDPISVDYNLGLAKVYFAAGEYQSALDQYQKSELLAVDANQMAKATTLARSAAAVAFRIGEEELARCASEEAYDYAKSPEELAKHAKMLIALGDLNSASAVLEGSDQNIEENAKLANKMALVQLGLGNRDQAHTLTTIASDLGLDDAAEGFENKLLQALFEPATEAEALAAQKEDAERVIEGPASLYLPLPLLDELAKKTESPTGGQG